MKLSEKISIDSIEYASQGNAILGIRNSGKSYTATLIAERLMDDNIPFIAFDPIGIWKYLKVGTGGKKGYPVVVAGDGGDLPLTPASSVDIVRAAMKENVSLVIDLYSMSLSKADWRQIVEKCIRLLLYENKTHGLRHIFIEEAAEFCPQRIPPEQGKVYAEIEKLARMGGNASLGYTLINQRAEEVNKAVLELCDCLFLHRQKGRHSLTALGKWLDVADTTNSKEIINSLPSLEQGECWVWLQGSHAPEKIKIPAKTTVHPDRKNPLKITSGIAVDVSKFVDKMNKSLVNPILVPDAKITGKEIAAAQSEIKKQYDTVIKDRDKTIKYLHECVRSLQGQLAKINQLSSIVKEVSSPGLPLPVIIPTKFEPKAIQRVPSNGKVSGGAMRMLKVAAMYHPGTVTKYRMAAIARLSHSSGSFATYLSALKKDGLLVGEGNEFKITAEGKKQAGSFDELPTDPQELIELWCEVVGKDSGAARILRVLGERHPKELTKQEVGDAVGMSYSSGSFATYISTLKRNGLIEVRGHQLRISEELYN